MFQRSLRLRKISNLPGVQKLRSDNRLYCKSNADDVPKDSEEPPISKLLDDATSLTEIHSTEWTTTPYPASAEPYIEDQIPKREKINPTEKSLVLFPGQGIIKVGDVNKYLKFPRVKELYAIANEILGYDLLKISLNGPQKMLDRTEFNQPATVVLSLAALEKLQEERPKAIESCSAVAGYSVGELTALIFSGAMPYEEGLKLVSTRATAMQSAADLSPQGMLACYCTPSARISVICEEAKKFAMDIGAADPLCRVAIYLYSENKILGGSMEALEYVQKNAHKYGLRRLKLLPVSGAFHTALMVPAIKSFSKALEKVPFDEPKIDVYSNYSTKIYPKNNPKLMKKYLIKQLVSPVKWEQIMQKMYARPEGTRFPRTFDVGSNGSMKTILKKVNAKAVDSCYVY